MVQILLNSHLQPKRVEIELLKMDLRGIEPRSSHMRSEHSTSELQPRDMLHDAMSVLYSEPVGPVRLWLRMKWAEYPPEENMFFIFFIATFIHWRTQNKYSFDSQEGTNEVQISLKETGRRATRRTRSPWRQNKTIKNASVPPQHWHSPHWWPPDYCERARDSIADSSHLRNNWRSTVPNEGQWIIRSMSLENATFDVIQAPNNQLHSKP